MAKKRQSSLSVRQNAKRREEELRRRRNSQIMTAGIVVAVVAVAAFVVFVLLNPGDEDPETAVALDPPGPLAEIEPAERAGYYDRVPEMSLDPDVEYEALIQTEKGDIRLELFADEAPVTVNNFVFLARQGFYDGTLFHRVMPDFMAQAGDPTGTGAGGPGYQFEDEVDNGLVFDRPGLLAMANRGANTNGSQFFVTYVPTPHLDGLHTIFGELVEGEEVLNSLSVVQPDSLSTPQGDVIERIAIIER